ncbi:MAG: hypothetical protein ACLTEH_02880 [Clostridia bacterium]
MRGKKGVTLVSLVITIIVLIILAGVSINMLIGDGGIITKAQQAKENTQLSKIEEEKGINTLYAEMLNGNITGGGNEQGGQKDFFKAGDYVKYDSGSNGIITCRVLYTESSIYGLQIITNKNVKNVSLGGASWDLGKASYNHAITTLNNEAMAYLNTNYAIDARCVGTNPQDKNLDTSKTVPLQFVPNGWATKESGCKDEDMYFETDYDAMKASNIHKTGEYYWLASRYIDEFSSSSDFRVRCVRSNSDYTSYTICYVAGAAIGNTHSYGLRPCIKLKENVKVVSGDGLTEATAYELGI